MRHLSLRPKAQEASEQGLAFAVHSSHRQRETEGQRYLGLGRREGEERKELSQLSLRHPVTMFLGHVHPLRDTVPAAPGRTEGFFSAPQTCELPVHSPRWGALICSQTRL